jgi:RNA polymerase sigma-70 factor (ECF subfamily)
VSSDPQDLSDEELAARCCRELPHRTVAFDQLIERYEPLVFGSCLRILGNAQDAEEATQDVFLRLSRKIGLFHGKSKFKTWFYRLAHNVAFEVRKRAMRRKIREQELAENIQECSAEPVARGDGGVVFDILEGMEHDQREVLLLRFASDLEFNQIADVLGLSLSAAKMRVYRALDDFEIRFRDYQSAKASRSGQAPPPEPPSRQPS